MRITRDDVDFALKPSVWDLGNEVLYDLCRNHPRHDRPGVIIAKVLLIGRTYAAAIERRKNAEGTSDDFYTRIVSKTIKNSGLDGWLHSLPNRVTDAWADVALAVKIHKRLTDLFFGMTRLNKRSLASKYLHFHRPDMFFLYDTRAKTALAEVTPSIRKIPRISEEESDAEYMTLCRRCRWVCDDVFRRFAVTLTPRQVDKILLRITDRIRKARTGARTVRRGQTTSQREFR